MNIVIIDINKINLRHLRSHISIVSQNPTLFNDTIEKNIAYGYQEIDSERLNQAAELSGCMEFIEKLPEGFNTEIGDDGVLLSGGQRQRLAIARAFYKDAPIIILDEATSSLDSESELVVQSAIEKLIVNRTTIIIAHRLSTIEGANKIFVIDDGRIVEQGNHAELIDRDGIYKNLYKNMDSNQVKTAAVITKKEKSYLPSFVEEPAQQGMLLDAWYKKSVWLWLLSPLSLLFSFFVRLRINSFKENSKKVWKPNVPVIVVGNISMGGTGKTPLVKMLGQKLLEEGFSPGIVSRGYGGKYSETLEVTSDTTFKQTGDEAQILAKLNVPFYIDKNRVRAVKKLTKNHECDVIISDDGLQHYKMGRHIEIAVIDGKRRFGNNLTFPAGPLREASKRIHTVDFIVNNSGPTNEDEYLMNISPTKFVHLKSGKSYSIENWPMHKQVHAVAGLGNPGRFFDLLDKLGFDIIRHPFPDHHNFLSSDIFYLDHLPIVMTEKDASKCKDFDNNKIWYLKIDADVNNKFIDNLDKKLKSIS